MGVVQNAAWWAADYLYAARAQILALDRRIAPGDFLTGHLTPVVVLPGVYEPWRFMLPMIRMLHGDGHPVHVVDPLQNNRRPVAHGAEAVGQYLRAQQLEQVIIVAHSKGGLLGKHVMAFSTERHRILSMVAIATPFGGSSLARYQLSPTLRSFSPRDATLRKLNAEHSVNERIVSVFAAFDPHIPEGSWLEGAQNIEIDTGGHFRILAHPETLRIVRDTTRNNNGGRADHQ